MKPRRKYTPEDKATALTTLKSCGGNVTRAAAILRVPRKTLEMWSKGNAVTEVKPTMLADTEVRLAAELDKIADLLTNSMQDPAKIEKASIRDLSVSLGITIDKRQLLRGSPTSITQRVVSEKERHESALKLYMEELKAQGLELSRDEAIKYLEAAMPGAKEYLN